MLTNEHLNGMFTYLDQQNRWTRNKLIGIGIVCGFKLVHHTGVIEITKGCGVTSQGYLIVKDAATYAYAMPYDAPAKPGDLPFDYPYGDLPFYKPFCSTRNVLRLLTDEEYNDLEDNKKPSAQTLSSQKAGFLNDYVVVLFLEATETDLKNCSAFDCTNKGEKMQFNIRPLLVLKKELPQVGKDIVATVNKDRLRFEEFELEKQKARLSHEITFRRFNVPYAALHSSTDVIRAFVKIVDDNTLHEVANAYVYCYEKYSSILNVTSNPFTGLFKKLRELRDEILKEYPIFIQYFYDFIDDLILAYFEFCTKISGIISQCCPDENLFPLHLVLGDAAKDTTQFSHDAWRTYFIYSPLFTKNNSDRNEAQFLFERMVLMVKDFMLVKPKNSRDTSAIRITPSQLGYLWLSQRAIPYYYRIATGEDAIYNYWNYYKSSHGNAVFNLSYNADMYNHAKAATQPLLYDIEHYNFFRIEGHIGEPYQAVRDNILRQRLEYNLPFDVVAISADLLHSNAQLPKCNMQDLEADYKLIVSEFACKVHTPFCFLTKMPYPPDVEAFTGNVKSFADGDTFSAYRVKAMAHFNSVSEIFNNSAYKLGDFMRKYCKPDDDNTVGAYYLKSLDDVYTLYGAESSVHSTTEQNAFSIIYNAIFAFIDAVEKLMQLLMTSTVATLEIEMLQKRYDVYIKALTRLTFILAELMQSGKLKLSEIAKMLELDLLLDEFFLLSTVCIDERIQTLLEEYTKRLKVFQAQNTFINYYKKHPGLEHKAGVPKGGTFVLVYYSAAEARTTEERQAEELPLLANNIDIQATGMFEHRMVKNEPAAYEKLSSNDERMILSFINRCQGATDDDKQKIIDIFTPKATTPQRFRFRDGEVIADFYVPYMCCSDCPPIAYILPDKREKPPVETPTIQIDPTFCENDKEAHQITVSPEGGKVTGADGNEVPGVDNSALTFTPGEAGAGEYKLIYTVNGESSPQVTVTVLKYPGNSKFEFKAVFNNQGVFDVEFTPAVKDAAFTYDWQFGDNFTPNKSSDMIAKVTAMLDATGGVKHTTATLQISNGICKAEPETVKLVITPSGITTDTSTGDVATIPQKSSDKKELEAPPTRKAETAGEKLNDVLKGAKKTKKNK